MDFLERLVDWVQIGLLAILGAIWVKLTKLKDDHAKTREQMATRPEITALTALLADTRESRMTRPEMIAALKEIKDDTDRRLDKIANKMESTEAKLVESESRTSQFRHDMREQMAAQLMTIKLLAQKVDTDISATGSVKTLRRET